MSGGRALAEPRLERSAFAHDAAILRLSISADGRSLASSAEDRTVRLWDLAALAPRGALPAQADWVQAMAFAPDGKRLALGRYDGSLALWDVDGVILVRGEPRAARAAEAAPAAVEPAPSLMRDATLNPPSPRGGLRGSKVKVTLTGIGVGRATSVLLPEPGVSAAILPAKQPDPNRLDVELTIAPDARVGLRTIGVDHARWACRASRTSPSSPTPRSPSGSRTTGRIKARIIRPPSRRRCSARSTARGTSIGSGSKRRPDRSWSSRSWPRRWARSCAPCSRSTTRPGGPLAQAAAGVSGAGGGMEPVLAYTARADGPMTLEVADADLGGSGAHFYRISAGPIPYVRSVFPMGVERATARTVIDGGLSSMARISGACARSRCRWRSGTEPGTIIGVPVVLPGRTGRERAAALRDAERGRRRRPSGRRARDERRADAGPGPAGARRCLRPDRRRRRCRLLPVPRQEGRDESSSRSSGGGWARRWTRSSRCSTPAAGRCPARCCGRSTRPRSRSATIRRPRRTSA